MNKRIAPESFGILTINDIFNYGNRLQNYALQEILKNYGDVTTIRFDTGTDSPIHVLKTRLRRSKISAISHIRIGLGGEAASAARRTLNSLEFTKMYVPDNKLCATTNVFPPERRLPDCIVLGSDQIWNHNFCSREDLKVRLGITAPANRLISYAASIGVSDIPQTLLPLYKEAFNRISSISVREDKAKELVESISGKEATVVLDPTLMLTVEQWSSLFREFVPQNEHYVLTYFLGKPSFEQERIITDYAEKNKLKIHKILDNSDTLTATAGPQDFVELFAKADYIFTDSYHACCFSLLFNKDFKVFSRSGYSGKANMNSRIATLARLFDLDISLESQQQISRIDYSSINRLISYYRTKSTRWIEKSIGR